MTDGSANCSINIVHYSDGVDTATDSDCNSNSSVLSH
jgi:hypothetical protein